MTYEIVLESLQSAYNWLFTVYFPRIFAFLKNNELVSAALIIFFVIPSLFIIINFFNKASSDSEQFASKVIKNKCDKAKKDFLKDQRRQMYYRNNIYQQAYYNSLKYDNKK